MVPIERPGLQRALDLARSGRVDLLLVYRVDRLSRKVRQLAQLAEELDKTGVVLRSATEPFDTGSAAGRMMLQMLAVFGGLRPLCSTTLHTEGPRLTR